MMRAIRYGLGAALAGGLALGTALAQSSTSGSSGTTGGGGASAGSDSTASGAPSAGQKVDKKLQDHLEKIHASNQAEIKFAELGSQSATSPQVKQFAEKMGTDHQKVDQKLTQQAQTMGVASLEGKTFQKEVASAQKDMKKLQGKTGSDFDKAFMDRMVKDHEKALKEVKSAESSAQKAKQPELASALQTAQTQIQGHIDQGKQVQKALKSGAGHAASGSSSPSMGTGSSATHGGGEKSTPSDTGKK
jgi:putative membrane protein